MKGIIFAFALSIALPNPVAAQNVTPAPQQTIASPTARFEIIQSPMAPSFTIRLDRYTGQVARLVATSDREEMSWENMEIVSLPAVGTATASRFQIFMSGSDFAQTFLLDTATGDTWRMFSEGGRSAATVWRRFRD